MPEDLPFLRAIFNRPDDDGLRLIYADWLDERGDPRARLVRLEVEWHGAAGGAKDRRAALAKQMGALWPTVDAGWAARMRQTRNLPRGARLDLAFVGEGKGLIEVRGGDGETVLLVEGKPVALNWDDNAGSVGQYLVFTGHTRGDDHARQLVELVEGEVDDGRPLADQIAPLLALFAPATYGLGYTPSTAVGRVTTFEYSGAPGADRELIEYYPFDDRNLVCTQARESLNEERVAFFRKQIRARRRPTVLTTSAEGAWCEFVIDGHHKLEAYNRQGMRPAVLEIVRWQAPAISLEEGLRFLPRGHRGVAEYRRMKGVAGR